MKTFMLLLLLAFVAPAMAAEIDSKANPDRYVADDLEIETLPNGEVVTRLVSKHRLTARQFWTNSVYPQGSIVVFKARGEPTPGPGGTHSAQKSEQPVLPNERAPNDRLDFSTQALESE